MKGKCNGCGEISEMHYACWRGARYRRCFKCDAGVLFALDEKSFRKYQKSHFEELNKDHFR